MKKSQLLFATALTFGLCAPAYAQDADDQPPGDSTARPPANAPIIVTAQRQAETLQSVPIAVSAFTAEALERQQIENVSDLQLYLPNIAFSRGNFTGSSISIRGVGNLCVGTACDSAIGIHVNDMPLLSTRLFETEYFDIERIEVLRGPQGTLFGRNATSGVINTITARPDLSGFEASAEFEYGNYDAMRAEGMVNIPLGEWAGLRVAGVYVNRDGYTRNLYDNTAIDDRELYAVRGSLRFEPTPDTVIDIIGYYFEEDDNRSRIQKQLCARDPTGVLGCTPNALNEEPFNANATLNAVFASRETLTALGGAFLGGLGLTSVYGPDLFQNAIVPHGLRTVNVDYTPTYYADEWFVMGRVEHDFGSVGLTVTGGYQETSIDTRTDFTLNVADPYDALTGRNAFNVFSTFANNPILGGIFAPAFNVLLPNGPTGPVCSSAVDITYAGVFGGDVAGCADRSIEFDRSRSRSRQYSVEAHIDSHFDGPFNFLLGAIYFNQRSTNSDYFVSASGVDYAAGVLGILGRLSGATATADYLGPSFFNSQTPFFGLESYGLFGETYIDIIPDELTLTVGARYSNDDKSLRDRSPLFNTLIPIGTTDVAGLLDAGAADFDASIAGNQPFREATASFDEVTGRVVLDWQWSPDNLVYASYSRGYKSGGINPPFDPVTFPNVPTTFRPEFINAFEIGSKNTIANGMLQLNATAFYYDYKDLQLNRILNRTSFNDNTDAEVYGIEIEAVITPDPAWMFNINLSFLETSIGEFELVDTRDPSGGRSDVVIVKDLLSAANCAVIPNTPGNAAGANAFVNIINGGIGNGNVLRPTVPVPGTTTTGAFSFCDVLIAAAGGDVGSVGSLNSFLAGIGAQLVPLQPQLDALGTFTIDSGAPVNLRGNQLPQAPNMKLSIGGQYTYDFENGMNLIFRGDYSLTGRQFARSFNLPVDRVPSYEIVNAQIQLNGAHDDWFVRAFVQNIFDNDAITGLFVQDPSVGLFTNVFTLEPRRYGVAAGFSF